MASPLLGKPLPPFGLTDQNGRRWTQADLPGKRTVIAVWALWCPPCLAELPQLQAAFLRAKPRSDAQLLTLNLDENPNDVSAFLKKARYRFASLLGGGAFHQQLSAGAKDVSIPRFFLVNEQGIVTKETSGPEGLTLLTGIGLASPATQPAANSR
jgi:thiol-disulfide isomerase/thioredoxin